MDMEEASRDLLGNKIALAICRCLWARNAGLSGRAIAKEIALSPQAVHNALKTLEGHHLILSQKVGPSHLYTINRRHFLLAEGLLPLWQKIFGWKEHLGNDCMRYLKKRPLAIVLFGSYAHDVQKKESDLDLLFIYEKEPSFEAVENIREMEGILYQKFGIYPSGKTISLKKFKTEIKKKEGLMRTIYREGKVIAGKKLTEL